VRLNNLRTFDSLKIPALRIYFLGMAGQWAASSMQSVVQYLLLFRLTGSTAMLGIMALASAIPQVLLVLFAGVLIDRFPKKTLLQIGQAASALTSITIAIFLIVGYLSSAHTGSWWILIVTSAVQGMANALLGPLRQAIIPELVNKDNVGNATALNVIGMNIFQLVSPAFGGFLVDKVNFETVFFTISGLYLLAIFLTNFIPVREVSFSGRRRVIAEMVEGFRYIRKNLMILWILIFTLLCVMVVLPFNSMISVFSDRILKVGATGLGLLQGFSAGGSFIIALCIASLAIKKRSMIMLSAGILIGLAQAAFAFSTSFPLSLLLMVLIGMGTIGQAIMATIILQTITDTAYLGRVLSVITLSTGIGGLVAFGSGFIAEAIGIQWTIGGVSLLLAVASILILFIVPKLRRID
jgi:MFS family permease